MAQDFPLHQPSAHTNQVDAVQGLVEVPAVGTESSRVQESEPTTSTVLVRECVPLFSEICS